MKIRIDRLKKLLAHMEQPQEKLGHKEFDFEIYDNGYGGECGTAGCMAGELPFIWPDKWRLCTSPLKNHPILKGGSVYILSTEWHLMQWFGLDAGMVKHLFYPHFQDTDKYGGKKMLNSSSKKEEVVENLREFIKWAENNA